jgi:deoxyribose-phosphate aldolase
LTNVVEQIAREVMLKLKGDNTNRGSSYTPTPAANAGRAVNQSSPVVAREVSSNPDNGGFVANRTSKFVDLVPPIKTLEQREAEQNSGNTSINANSYDYEARVKEVMSQRGGYRPSPMRTVNEPAPAISQNNTGLKAADLARYIDHTLLKANAERAEIEELCKEAREYSFASVCVNPTNVALAAELLRGSVVKVCTVIGFPLGATSSFVKAMETRDAVANGATEIDMVINVGALKSKDHELVRTDIERVVESAGGNLVKVILENSLLTDEEKIKACELSKAAGADFVKTSTGFSTSGATVEDIRLMRRTVGPEMGVKASGGIRDTATAISMIEAGATRIGASASVAIVKGVSDGGKGY